MCYHSTTALLFALHHTGNYQPSASADPKPVTHQTTPKRLPVSSLWREGRRTWRTGEQRHRKPQCHVHLTKIETPSTSLRRWHWWTQPGVQRCVRLCLGRTQSLGAVAGQPPSVEVQHLGLMVEAIVPGFFEELGPKRQLPQLTDGQLQKICEPWLVRQSRNYENYLASGHS